MLVERILVLNLVQAELICRRALGLLLYCDKRNRAKRLDNSSLVEVFCAQFKCEESDKN
jgi:hypothetical protein